MGSLRRLTYSPKAYVFIRSHTQGGRIYNVSPDVVSGNVTRNINDVSTAEVVLRNRFRKWLKDPENGMSIFMPMDMITIWLQRFAGKPIQVFTGFLDTVPYYQMYPGNCTLTATCTLKRLKYSWYDAGLDWFQQWLMGIDGWEIIDRETGEVRNVSTASQELSRKGNKINDGGFADLIQRFMLDIAGWSPDHVVVSDLPAHIPKVATQLYQRVQEQNAVAQDALEQMFKNIIGISASPITANQSDMLSHSQQSSAQAIRKVAGDKGMPVVVPFLAAVLATGFQPNYAKRQSRAHVKDDWGYGIYAMKPKLSGENDHRTNQGVIYREGDSVGGVDKSKLANVTTATEVFCSRLAQVNTPQDALQVQHRQGRYDQAKQGDLTAMKAWIETALNRTFGVDDFHDGYTRAYQLMQAFSHTATGAGQITDGLPTPQFLTWHSPEIASATGVMDTRDQSVFLRRYHKANDSLAPYYWMARAHYSGIHLADPGRQSTDTLYLAGGSSDLQSLFDSVKTHTEYDTITLSLSSATQTEIVTFKHGHQHSVSRVPGMSGPHPVSQIILTVRRDAAYPAWTTNNTQGTQAGSGSNDVRAGGSNTASAGQFSLEDLGKISFASAYLSHFTLASNLVEARYLTGFKALANDAACLDGVKQFCQASLRSFMSLPDGKFCAFYPDYFGAHGRKPYWNIYDIEITNGGVQLNDEELVTHVYTTGDTFANNEEIDLQDYIFSAGVVTLDMGILAGFIQPLQNQADETNLVGKNENLGVLKTAADFVYHYGARVYKEEIPQIRNQYFEFLYAWQRFMQKWAATFQTEIEFTFQPEVMCGGIIGFPQHNLQMFVEQVTHTWDYSEGFHTQAVLSAPAAMNATKGGDIGSLPGFALAGNINSVGTPSG